MKYNKVQSSGKMQKFKNGAVRDSNEGKGRFDLIPAHAEIRIAKHFGNGSQKYGDDNWKIGMSQKRFLESLFRHAVKYKGGDRSEDHLAAICWNAMAMIHQEEMFERGLLSREFDDLKYREFLPDEFDETKKKSKKKVKKNAKKKRKR